MQAALLSNHRVGITRALTGVIERAGVYEPEAINKVLLEFLTE